MAPPLLFFLPPESCHDLAARESGEPVKLRAFQISPWRKQRPLGKTVPSTPGSPGQLSKSTRTVASSKTEACRQPPFTLFHMPVLGIPRIHNANSSVPSNPVGGIQGSLVPEAVNGEFEIL